VPQWSTSCPDWKQRIVDGRSLIPFDPLFPDVAAAKMDLFTSLRLMDVTGQPTIGEASDERLLDFARAVFGAYDPETGNQLITEFMLLIAKKNTKSTLAAALLLTELALGWRHEDENLVLGPTKEVADNCFQPAKAMARADPRLRELLHIQEHQRLITHRQTKSTLKVVAADSNTVSGKKSSRVIVDELWLFGPQANAGNMFQEATGGQISKPEGYTIWLTTQSDKPPAGVYKEKLNYFRDVRDGKIIDNKKLPILYEFPEEMIANGEHLDPKNFYVTNPNLGRSVSQSWLESKLQEKQAGDKADLNVFLAKHLNIENGMGLRSDSWAGAEFWELGADPAITLDQIIERSEVIIVGLDGGGLDDLYGLTVLGRESEDAGADAAPETEYDDTGTRVRVKRWLSWSHAWAHSVVLERRKSIAGKLKELESAGELTILPDGAMSETGLPADIAAILDVILQIRDAGLLCCVAVDPAGLGELVDALAAVDIIEDNKPLGRDYIIGAPQGYAMMNALKTAERKLANGTLLHADQALMTWCVANLKIEATATAIRATKQSAGDAKIDAAMALFNAVTIMATNPDACRSIYETQGLRVI